MARSHLCGKCGLELGLIAPEREAVYGFAIVRCPRCASVWVRRHAELDRVLRRWRLGVGALASVMGTVAMLGFCLLVWGLVGLAYTDESLSTGCRMGEVLASALAEGWYEPGSTAARWRESDLQVAAVAVLCIAVVTGAMLTVVLGHLGRVLVWGLAVLTLLLCAGLFYVLHVTRVQDAQSGDPVAMSAFFTGSAAGYFTPEFVLEWMRLQGVMGVVALAGIPLGRISKRRVNRIRLWLVRRLRASRRRDRRPD